MSLFKMAAHDILKIKPSRHKGVECKGCLKEDFDGFRFKCDTCADFDLCGNCMALNDGSNYH